MGLLSIPNGDQLYRLIVFPIAFKGGKNKSFAFEKFITLHENPGGLLLGSLSWERYAPMQTNVHAYGCRLAAKINLKKKSKGKTDPKYRNTYCGAYMTTAKSFRALSGTNDIELVDVRHNIEDGEISHADLRIQLSSTAVFDEGTKTLIADRLWNLCKGPLQHSCPCDINLQPHPKEQLVEPQSGGYVFRRHFIMTAIYLARFWLLWAPMRLYGVLKIKYQNAVVAE